MAPTASIVITVYNQAAFLAALLRSLRAQTLKNWEAIVVDDGSSDNTSAVANSFSAQDRRIRYIHKENSGPGDSRNVGFLKTNVNARYVAFVDGDDVLAPNFIEMMTGYLDSHLDVVSVTCAYDIIDEAGALLGRGVRSRWVPGRILPRALNEDEVETPFVAFYCATGQGPFALHRREVVKRTKGWVTYFWPHEDTDFFCQMALQGPIHHIPKPYYIKRDHKKSIIREGLRSTSSHFNPNSYHLFRRRWCKWEPAGEMQRILLEDAHRYYMCVHRPLRDLKVAVKSLKNFLKQQEWRHIKWACFLISRTISDFMRFRLLRQKPNRAGDITRFPL